MKCPHKHIAVIERYGMKSKKEWVKCLNPECLLDGMHCYETATTKEYTSWYPEIYKEPKNVKKIIKKKNDKTEQEEGA